MEKALLTSLIHFFGGAAISGEFVAQIKFTVLIQPTGTARITQFPLPSFTSEHKIQVRFSLFLCVCVCVCVCVLCVCVCVCMCLFV